MPTFYLDDQPVEFEPGEKVLAAAIRNGAQIPHYCYHPALSIVATCRMCLVDIQDMGNGRPAPKLQTSCSTEASEGMKVYSNNEKVKDAREVVMEFLLVNHPLDCPICDQSGECDLQDYSFEYGSGESEMEYSKRVYGLRDIGTFVTLERNRCIHCTRCERFTSEITETHEFGTFNRGHQLTVDTYTDQPMTNQFQGNMADICPVGCITEKEFRFKKRVWKLVRKPSVCTGCSTGCNIDIHYYKNEVYRFKPRENQAVNQWWMCDEGRLTYRHLNERKMRVMRPVGRVKGDLLQADWEQSFEAFRERVKELSPSGTSVIAVTDTHASNEEMYALKQLMLEGFSSDQVFYPATLGKEANTGRFIDSLITTDKSPNQAGAVLIGLQGDPDGSKLQELLEQGIKVAIVVGNPFGQMPSLVQSFSKAEFIVHITTLKNEWSEIADLMLPAQNHAEKLVSYTNKHQRIQKTQVALRAPEWTKPDWKIMRELSLALGKGKQCESVEVLFEEMSENIFSFQGLRLEKIGLEGCSLPVKDSSSSQLTEETAEEES